MASRNCLCTTELESWHDSVRHWNKWKRNYFVFHDVNVTENGTVVFHDANFETDTKIETLTSISDEEQKLTKEFAIKNRRYVMQRYGSWRQSLKAKVPENRLQWFIVIIQVTFSIACIALGISLSGAISDQQIDTKQRLASSALLGCYKGSGALSLLYFLSVEAMVEQTQLKHPLITGYGMKLLAGCIAGSLSDTASFLISDIIYSSSTSPPTHVSNSISTSNANNTNSTGNANNTTSSSNFSVHKLVIEGCLVMAINVFMFALADGIVSGSYLVSSASAVFVDLTLVLLSGSVAGAFDGLLIGHMARIETVFSGILRHLGPRLSRYIFLATRLCIQNCSKVAVTHTGNTIVDNCCVNSS